jgi:hypothetical protein
VLAFEGLQPARCKVTLSSKRIVGFEWRVAFGLCDQPNSLPGGFADVEVECDETVAGVGSTPVAPAVSDLESIQ